jgi:hypothetical protein
MKFSEIQQKLNAPKNLYNKFGNYSYRSCESILEAVKPLLGEAILTITDDIVEVGGRIYVKATARFVDGDFNIENTAFAREEEVKKGMDASQITGSASSYARKYALNGLLCIDDLKDPDSQDNSKKSPKKEPDTRAKPIELPEPTLEVIKEISQAISIDDIKEILQKYKKTFNLKSMITVATIRKEDLEK